MLYDRKIRYLDYWENGERIHGAGFVKLEVRENKCRLTINVSGMHVTDQYARQVYLIQEEGEEALCEIKLYEGKGVVECRKLDCDNLGGTGISYAQLQGIHIPIAAGKEIRCVINPSRTPKARAEKAVQPDKEKEVQPDREEAVQPDKEEAVQPDREEAVQPDREEAVQPDKEKVVQPDREEAVQPEAGAQQEQAAKAEPGLQAEPEKAVQGEPEAAIQTPPKQQAEPAMVADSKQQTKPVVQPESAPVPEPPAEGYPLLDEKWRQLSAIYPHIAPFQDEREYLSICPEDFVILSEKDYKLVSNSFLLHGYYNYNHLILAQAVQRGEIRYYVGVPGNFYEREKQVAVMFGFESFECREEPARQGDYGYYMIHVEL